MPVILSSATELKSRGVRIQKLLRPLTGRTAGPAWSPRIGPLNWIIGTHDGSPPQSDHQDWRFATVVPRLRANYFELWKRTDVDEESWHLDRAYLNMFLRVREEATFTEKKFLSLHCDPNEPDHADHAKYKKEPHLHVQAADEPFPHAHIVLTGGYRDMVLDSIDSLSEAMEWAVHMLKDEVLNAIK